MKDILESKNVRATLWIVGTIIALLVVFGLGTVVGYRRAMFANGFGENYYQNFYGTPGTMLERFGPHGPTSFSMHGAAGVVIDVATSTLSVNDPAGNESSIVVTSGTMIREMDGVITLQAIKVGDAITVIGGPNDSGQIEARFIRVFGPASSVIPPAPQQ